MANQYNSLSHTKWLCKYHIVIVPKYRRKVIYNHYRKDLQEIIRTLCKYKGVEIIEGHFVFANEYAKSNFICLTPSLITSQKTVKVTKKDR